MSRLASLDKTQILQPKKGQVGESVVDHQMIHIPVLDPCLFKCLMARRLGKQ